MKIDDETYGAVKLNNQIVIGIVGVSDIVRIMLVSVNSDQIRNGSILEVDKVSNKFVQGFLTCVPIRGGSAQKRPCMGVFYVALSLVCQPSCRLFGKGQMSLSLFRCNKNLAVAQNLCDAVSNFYNLLLLVLISEDQPHIH